MARFLNDRLFFYVEPTKPKTYKAPFRSLKLKRWRRPWRSVPNDEERKTLLSVTPKKISPGLRLIRLF